VKIPTILTPQKVFDKYKKDIEIIFRGQQDASTIVISAILEIGRVCKDARAYKNRLNLKNKDDLWGKFEKSLPISKSSISKYISIYQHPVIRLKKYHRNLPSSVFSLYELSKIKDAHLEKLLMSGKIHSDIGRTELNLLLQGKTLSKRLTQSANEVEVLSIRLPVNSWEDKFEDVRYELIEFLEQRGLGYALGNEIQKREKLEVKQSKNVQKYVFTQLKKYFTRQIKSYIEQQGKNKNLFKRGKQITFKRKAELVGFHFDEVDCSSDISDEEIKQRFLGLGIGDENDWNNLVNKFMGDAFEKYPYPKHLLQSQTKSVKFDPSLIPIRKQQKIDKSRFKEFKV